jgi:hypothetical protein
MKSPKLWRKKRGARFVGSWHATVGGDDVNFRTTDAEEARKRLREAVQKGRRNFADDEAAVAHLEEPANPPLLGASTSPGSDAGASPAPSAAPPAPPNPPPLAELPPMPANDTTDADDMAAAAEAVAGGAANDNAGNAQGAEADPEVLDALLKQGALVIVDAQLQLQAYAIKRRTGKIAAEVPHDSPLRTGAAEAWAAQLKVWFPSATALPPWAMALILPALAMPMQLAGARNPEDIPADPLKAAAQ